MRKHCEQRVREMVVVKKGKKEGDECKKEMEIGTF